MRLNVAVCDDEKEQTERIAAVVTAWAEREGHRCALRTFASSEEFLFEYESDSSYDVLLLDVEMGDISGISLAKKIRKENNRSEIIFVTSHFEFVGEGYEVDALHYLVKPISEEKLCEVLSKAAEKLSEEPPSVVITCDGETVKLYESEILYVESFLHYIMIHTKEKAYKIKESISLFEEKLSEDFFRAHRSYLISLKHIVRISRTGVLLDDRTELPLARGKYNDINRAFIVRN
ncbi:MAG: response regulator transcription factor [Clostridia bacterium]|nr:response regulator transcription factor [Clostridia bacterium]